MDKVIFDKQNIAKKLCMFEGNNFFVLADFSKTFSSFSGPSTWSAVSKSGAMPAGYVEERQQLFDKYHPYEIDETLSLQEKNALLSEWWQKHMELFVKHGLTESVLESCIDQGMVTLRPGLKEFLADMKKRNVPVIILSSGIGRLVEKALEIGECNFDNIKIIANNVKFENAVATKIETPFVHTYNKQDIELPKLHTPSNMLLLGDKANDIIKPEFVKNAINIGFLEDEAKLEDYKKDFDVVCLGDFIDLMKAIKL